MSYIYDVVVNLTNPIIDYFEWNKSDNITHLRKTPIIKVDSNTLFDLTYNKIKIKSEILSLIKNKSDSYSNKNDFEFICVFTDTYTNICVKFKDGINILKSELQFDINEEIDEFSHKLNTIKIDYDIIENNYNLVFKTRREKLIENYVTKNIKLLDKNDDIKKLKYIYYDCFNEKCENKDKIIKRLLNEINNISEKIYNFLKLTSINK